MANVDSPMMPESASRLTMPRAADISTSTVSRVTTAAEMDR